MKTYLGKGRMMLSWLMATSLALSGMMSGCGKDDPNPQAEKLRLLSGTWTIATVDNDGVDVTSQYNGFTLTVTSTKTYSTTNGHNAWPAGGTFEFQQNDLNQIMRDDGVVVTIESATEDQLQLSFQQSTLTGGRPKGVTGDFVFSLVK